ncbi:UNVERIFIED_CONTAM: hypothetical protein Sradi_6898700 [Sesamum radiatum]|uniref:DUF4283 domain-containing protein n=1 Tax=Sesamum radiatum TaxID=300843 RepID=A0AAW2JIZ9_SESRA
MADSGDEGSGSPLNRGSLAAASLENSAQDSQDLPRASPPHPTPVSAPEVFVGNVKLSMDDCDTIADAFLNSSRKTLRFIPPTSQKDEILIKPTPAMVAQGSRRWQSTAVGYFLGRRPYFPQLEAFARANWKGLQQVSATSNGFFFFRFKTTAFMEEVIEEGPWLFQGQPVVLQPWEQGMSLRRQKHLQVPVWIRIRHLPMEYWTEDGLSAVASGIGTPLYADKITKNCLRLDFARVFSLLSLGHTANACPEMRVAKQRPPVAVYVQKRQSTEGGKSGEQDDEVAKCCGQVEVSGNTCPNQQDDNTGGDVANFSTTHRQNIKPCPEVPKANAADFTSKGKEIIVYNSFAALESDEADGVLSTVLRSTGPNLSSPADLPP